MSDQVTNYKIIAGTKSGLVIEGATDVLLDAWHVSTQELSGSGTLDVVEGGADHSSVVHFSLSLTSPLVNRNCWVSGSERRHQLAK